MRLVRNLILGVVLAFITAQLLMRTQVTKVNGWITVCGCGEPGNGLLKQAACALILPSVNVPEEAMYWRSWKDGGGNSLDGKHDYLLRFPPGGLPPNQAFWSLTMGDWKNQFVPNPMHRYSVGDRSGLVPNTDGSTDIYIQNGVPAGHESNWLPAPAGKFILWLRVYLPGKAVLDGGYQVPPVMEVK